MQIKNLYFRHDLVIASAMLYKLQECKNMAVVDHFGGPKRIEDDASSDPFYYQQPGVKWLFCLLMWQP